MPGDSDHEPPPVESSTERTIRSLEALHVDYYRGMPRLVRAIGWCTTVLAESATPMVLALTILAWMLFNTFAQRLGLKPFDPYPFPLLALVGTLFAMVTTLLIIGTQRRDDRLDEKRSQLTLQMATLSEQKIAKVIALLEEQRRDSPHLSSRRDAEADELAVASDPKDVLDRISEAHEGA
jgi:uncharacterized membrane protein